MEETNLRLYQTFNSWMATPAKCMAALERGTQEVFWCVILLPFNLIKSASVACRSPWKYRDSSSFFFFTPWFTVPDYEEIISIFPLDELLLIGNYLTTIDDTLVNNSATDVHNMRETDRERKRGSKRDNGPPPAIRATGSGVTELQH